MSRRVPIASVKGGVSLVESQESKCIETVGDRPGAAVEARDWSTWPVFVIGGLILAGAAWLIFGSLPVSALVFLAVMGLFITTVRDAYCTLTVCVNASGLTTSCGDITQAIPFSQIRSVKSEFQIYQCSDFVIRTSSQEIRIPDNDHTKAEFFMHFGQLLLTVRGRNLDTNTGARRRMGWVER
jgi:hypothetical protein